MECAWALEEREEGEKRKVRPGRRVGGFRLPCALICGTYFLLLALRQEVQHSCRKADDGEHRHCKSRRALSPRTRPFPTLISSQPRRLSHPQRVQKLPPFERS